MIKRIVLAFLSIFCISMFSYGIDAWIRINQLGYLPNAQKRAVLISENLQDIQNFSIHDALTNETVATFSSITKRGEFSNFKSTFILDFSNFKLQGAFYIKAGFVYSPTIYINNNIYLGTSDILLIFLRQQRCNYYSSSFNNTYQPNGFRISSDDSENRPSKFAIDYIESNRRTRNSARERELKDIEDAKAQQTKFVDIKGGWQNTADFIQYGSTSANVIFQLLFAYQMNPTAFADTYNASGEEKPNNIPDILDEAKWGLDWLLKMYPKNDTLFFQMVDNSYHSKLRMGKDEKNYSSYDRTIYIATGKPQGTSEFKNKTSGIASIAGKYASAFALGSDLLADYYPNYADTLVSKATWVYEYGKKFPGVCQSIPDKSGDFHNEDNWADDMELAAAQLYRLTYDSKYLIDAASFGRTEPITPWMCTDTAKNKQWYPYLNLGHFMLANLENPRYRKEFNLNMISGIHRMSLRAKENPFNIGVPLIKESNNMVAALATQCMLYRSISKDSTYLQMENSLVDWLYGCNPWGASMIIGMPQNGNSASEPYSSMPNQKRMTSIGGLVNGPVQGSVYKNAQKLYLLKPDEFAKQQSSWAVYHDDFADFMTNEPTLDGTASLTYLLSAKQLEVSPDKTSDRNQYSQGGIIKTDPSKKNICLVFTGNNYADGFETINETLNKLNIKASFFFTGDFYRNNDFSKLIKELQAGKHYLGAYSDKFLTYCSKANRDSTMVDKTEFLKDLNNNYKAMLNHGIAKNTTHFFLPPNGSYNNNISKWCKEVGLYLVSPTPDTYTNADLSIPEMRDRYFSSLEISNYLLTKEAKQGLNGNILQFNIGADKRRSDKYYTQLYSLIIQLSRAGYNFVSLEEATNLAEKTKSIEVNLKQKRKN